MNINTLTVRLDRYDFDDYSPADQDYGETSFLTTHNAFYAVMYGKDEYTYVMMQDESMRGWVRLNVKLGKLHYIEWLVNKKRVRAQISYEGAIIEVVFPLPK